MQPIRRPDKTMIVTSRVSVGHVAKAVPKDNAANGVHQDNAANGIPLKEVLGQAEEAIRRLPPAREQSYAEFGPPHVRPPKMSPEIVRAEFEQHAASCENILREIRMILKVEEQSWERLAVQYRELGEVQAAAVEDMLTRMATLREIRASLTKALDTGGTRPLVGA